MNKYLWPVNLNEFRKISIQISPLFEFYFIFKTNMNI